MENPTNRRSANFRTALRASAESRRCPMCGRKSALLFHSDDIMYGRYCRWEDCNYERLTVRPSFSEIKPERREEPPGR